MANLHTVNKTNIILVMRVKLEAHKEDVLRATTRDYKRKQIPNRYHTTKV